MHCLYQCSVVCPVQFSSVAQSCPTLSDPMNCSTPGLPVHHQLPEFTQTHVQSIESVMPSSHLIFCHPLLLLPPIPPSIRVFSNESTLRIRWPNYRSFSFSIIPSKEILGLISFRMDWLDLLAVQGTVKSLLQHHSSTASILWHSAFFTVQLSPPCFIKYVYFPAADVTDLLQSALSQSRPILCYPVDYSQGALSMGFFMQ